MSKPQVFVVPPLSGVGNVPSVQVPLVGTNTVTLINLSTTLGLTLCNDTNFTPNTTWPLNANTVMPQPGINNLWVQNPNSSPVNVLVLDGIVPVSTFPGSVLPPVHALTIPTPASNGPWIVSGFRPTDTLVTLTLVNYYNSGAAATIIFLGLVQGTPGIQNGGLSTYTFDSASFAGSGPLPLQWGLPGNAPTGPISWLTTPTSNLYSTYAQFVQGSAQ